SGIERVDSAGKHLDVRLPITLARGKHYFLEGKRLEGKCQGSYQVHNTLVAPRGVVESIGGWDEQLRGTEHDDFFLRLNAVCSIQGMPQVTYRMTVHTGARLSEMLLARAEAMRYTLEKHREVFVLHRRRRALYLSAMGITYLRAGSWASAVRATSHAVLLDPLHPRTLLWWVASLSGPRVLEMVRRLSPRLLDRFRGSSTPGLRGKEELQG
ncbi:MAG: hypothetical protein M3N51_11425, partial [Actinomycetota bacterium]|nr:hypothetical protein [Actinomycetota bacterium]